MASDDSKRIVLARRARFLSAALAGLAGCAPAHAPERGSSGSQGELVIPPLPADAAVAFAADAGALASDDHEVGPAQPSAGSPVEPTVPKVIVSVCLSIILPPTITFAPRAANVAKSASQMIDEVVRTLAANPQLRLEIEGNTDSTEPAALGQQRADAVRREIERRGIDSRRLTTTNAGATKPLDTSNTAEARARNRRIEFRSR